MVFVVSNNCISAVLQAGYASLQNSTDIPQKLLSLQYLFTHFLGHYRFIKEVGCSLVKIMEGKINMEKKF